MYSMSLVEGVGWRWWDGYDMAVGTPSFSNLKLKYLCEYEKVR